jgi:RNA polymerase sigma-70 factor (ECF subfamily)
MPMAKPAEPPTEVQVASDEALAAIYGAHFAFVWRSLRGLGFSNAEAEDLAQDVFLVVRRRLPDFDRKRPIKPWLFGILRRVAADRRRSTRRAERRLRLLPSGHAHGDPDRGPEDGARSREAAEFVDAFLAELGDARRTIFVLSEIEGLSGTEIAEALGINRNTVYTRLRAARQQFRDALLRRSEP